MIQPRPGVLLIADPFMKDPNFNKTVAIICDHDNEGSLGLVLNRPFKQKIGDIVPELAGFDIPIFYGGPVQQDALHFLHAIPDQVSMGLSLNNGVFSGGDFKEIIRKILDRTLDISKIRFFMGYSGWGLGQLEEEIKEKAWLLTEAKSSLVFDSKPDELWRDAVLQMDKAYHEIINYPSDPSLN